MIGINTQKIVKKNVTGIGFALSATDLLEVLHRFYPNISAANASENGGPSVAHASSAAGSVAPTRGDGSDSMTSASTDGKAQLDSSTTLSGTQTAGTPSEPFASRTLHGFGAVVITSDPEDAEIYVGDKFVGNAPAKLKLAAGNHIMVLKAAGFAEWKRTLEILKDSQVTLKPVLDHAP